MINLRSDRMPEIPAGPSIGDLFSNLSNNWSMMSPALYLLFGVMFGSYILMRIFKRVRGTDE